MSLLLLQHTLYGGAYKPDDTRDLVFTVNGLSAAYVADSSKDLVFVVNGLNPATPAPYTWVPDSTKDLVFIVNGSNTLSSVVGEATYAYPAPNSAYSQSYITPSDGINRRLTSATYKMLKSSTWQGTLQVEVYTHSGVYGVSSTPSGSALAASTILSDQDLAVTYTDTVFPFVGGNQLLLPPATAYVFVIKVLTSNGVTPGVTLQYAANVNGGNAGVWTN